MAEERDPDDARRILHGITDLGYDLFNATAIHGQVIYPPPALKGEQYAKVRLTIEYEVGLEEADKLAAED